MNRFAQKNATDLLASLKSFLGTHRFVLICASVSLIGAIVNIWVFYPGYMSYDSLEYLKQAIGVAPYDSLHPIFMSILWKVLNIITGHISSLLIFMVLMQWFGFLLIALYLYRKQRNKKLSIIVLLLPLLPYIFNISGVMWSDVLSANLLVVSAGLTLWLKEINKKQHITIILLVVLFMSMYGVLLRYNTIPAAIPIVYLALRRSRLFEKRYTAVILTAVVVMISFSVLILSPKIVHIKDLKLINAVLLDEIVNMSSKELIEKYSSGKGSDYIKTVYRCAHKKQVFADIKNVCGATTGNGFESALPYSDDIKRVWFNSIVNNKLDYVEYKIQNYVTFLFPADQNRYIWHSGINKNDMGEVVRNPRVGGIVYTVVNNLYYKYAPFLFEPWFWLTVSSFVLYASVRMRRVFDTGFLGALSLSSILIILSYVPTGATVDYRYIYWSAMATTICVLILCARIDFRKIKKTIKAYTITTQF